ncbi:IclR family transcriptional regulator [Natronorubrum halophilum]|uniref:IclR family transcriptional regulator n=1 Tax=Natronorubrum halophilum TaxID=1702106 RepID=UPI000EF757C6|nr:IclR family transcriptional regulator [Natronorubrum halophilum]
MSTQKTVGSVKRSFEIIWTIRELGGARINEVSAYTGITESSIHSHLTTLEEEGYIRKEGHEYDIGFRFLQLSRYVKHQNPLYHHSVDKLNTIARETGEVASIMAEQNGVGYYILGRKDPNSDRPGTEGKTSILHCCAPGKAILAHYSRDRVQQIISKRGLTPLTDRSITDEAELFNELEKIRERGVAFNRGECLEGLRGVAVPIKGKSGKVVAALSVYGPSHQMKGEFLENDIPELLKVHANDIQLGVMYGDD